MITAQHLQPRLWPPDKPSVAPTPKEILIKSSTSCFIALLHLLLCFRFCSEQLMKASGSKRSVFIVEFMLQEVE